MNTAADEPVTACAACGARLMGRYCHACGQDVEARPRPLRQMAYEAFSESSLIDDQGVRTLVALVTRPSRILIAYRAGAGSLYASPIKIFVVVTALFLAVLGLGDVVIYQYVRAVEPGAQVTATPDPDGVTVHVSGATERDNWMQRRVEPAVDPRIHAAMEAAAARATTEVDRQNLLYEIQSDREQEIICDRIIGWLPNALWLMTPLFALLLAPLFGRRRLFMEHLVFAMWAHVMAFSLLMLLALANWLGANLPAWPLIVPYMAYFIRAAARYYDMSYVSAAWRSALHAVLYVCLVLIPALLVLAVSALDWAALEAFLAA